jgi:hypothetical protein
MKSRPFVPLMTFVALAVCSAWCAPARAEIPGACQRKGDAGQLNACPVKITATGIAGTSGVGTQVAATLFPRLESHSDQTYGWHAEGSVGRVSDGENLYSGRVYLASARDAYDSSFGRTTGELSLGNLVKDAYFRTMDPVLVGIRRDGLGLVADRIYQRYSIGASPYGTFEDRAGVKARSSTLQASGEISTMTKSPFTLGGLSASASYSRLGGASAPGIGLVDGHGSYFNGSLMVSRPYSDGSSLFVQGVYQRESVSGKSAAIQASESVHHVLKDKQIRIGVNAHIGR